VPLEKSIQVTAFVLGAALGLGTIAALISIVNSLTKGAISE